ncbi:MAG: DUF5706 domain-containing protein [Deltaproteobacteria bacterium]|jgi:hypothetical protein|nr:DUF5706 domain-containing protein [Deltaproteobacteria bacterium]
MDQSKTHNKIEFLWKVIARYDHYIDSTNAKASLIIAWNGIVIGAILLQYESILKAFSDKPCGTFVATFGLVLLGFSSLVSNFFVFRVVTPYVPENKKQKSLIYFNSVSSMDCQQYNTLLNESNDSSMIFDLSQQVTELAGILKNKMRKTKISILFMSIGLGIIYLMFAYKIS